MRRVALVTGAAGGIGVAIVELFRRQEWEVIVVDRAQVIPEASLAIQADLARVEEIERICAQVRERFSRLDALVNNAAEQIVKPLSETTPQEWDEVMAINVRAPYLLTSKLYVLLKHVKGSIVNVASIHALATSRGMAAYAASKGALVALTRSMAVEFAQDGVRANGVLPGAVDTPMLAAGLRREFLAAAGSSGGTPLETLATHHPLGRVGRPEEIAQAVGFLADTERSSFMTGQMLIVDGGAYAQLSTE